MEEMAEEQDKQARIDKIHAVFSELKKLLADYERQHSTTVVHWTLKHQSMTLKSEGGVTPVIEKDIREIMQWFEARDACRKSYYAFFGNSAVISAAVDRVPGAAVALVREIESLMLWTAHNPQVYKLIIRIAGDLKLKDIATLVQRETSTLPLLSMLIYKKAEEAGSLILDEMK